MSSLNTNPSKRRTRSYLLAIVFSVFLSGCDVELFSELDERNANDILLVLSEGGISATKSRVDTGIWQISVQSDAVQDALSTVRRHGLPRAQFVSLGDVFAKEGLIATPAEERQRYAFAVSQELSNTLMQIEGVVVARVHPVIPLIDPLSDILPTPTAAVFIKHLQDADLEPMVPTIKRLVAQSIEGLDPRNVALTFSAAAAVPISASPQPTEPARVEASSLVISGGLALAALVCWPIRRLSLRMSGNYWERMTTDRRQSSAVESIKRWQSKSRLNKSRQPVQEEDDGWNV